MKNTVSQARTYIIPAMLGAVAGGIFVMVATRAIPTMVTNIMSGMMEKMKDQMATCGCNPLEMCQKMMSPVEAQNVKE